MLEAFEYEDIDKNGKLTMRRVKIVCKAFKIPISSDRLDILLDNFTTDGQTDYAQFVDSINWRENPTEPCNPDDLACNMQEAVDIPAQHPVAYNKILSILS